MCALPLPEAVPKQRHSHKTAVVLRLTVAALSVGVIVRAGLWISEKTERRTEPPQRIVLVDANELPPPEPPPEPEMEEVVEEEVEIESAEPIPDELANVVDDALGVDASGVAGSDMFGLKAKKGGRNLLDTGALMDPMQRFARYFVPIEQDLKRILEQNDELRQNYYKVYLRLWITNAGQIERCEIARSTGDVKLDKDIVNLIQMSRLEVEPPPDDMPQPIKLVVRSVRQS